MIRVSKHQRPSTVGADKDLPFTAGRWAVAKSGVSINLPDGGKIRQEGRNEKTEGNMRLIQAAPALWEMALDYRAALQDPNGLSRDDRDALIEWITKLERWVYSGELDGNGKV